MGKGVNKLTIVASLQEISLLLRLESGDPFRSRAYAKAAQAVAEFEGDFSALVEQRQLTEIRGIGQSLAAVIEEIYVGRSSLLENCRRSTKRRAHARSGFRPHFGEDHQKARRSAWNQEYRRPKGVD